MNSTEEYNRKAIAFLASVVYDLANGNRIYGDEKERLHKLVEELGYYGIRRTEKMTGNEYQKLAMRTCSFSIDQKREMADHAALGLSAEAGEVAGIFQKAYQGHPIDPEHVKKELGDCLWMIAELSTVMGFTLEEVMEENIEKLKKRYPDGFDAEHSLHRAEGDI